MASANTITGTAQVKLSLSGDYDTQPSSVDTDIIAKFTKSILGATPKNLQVITGVYNPTNDELVIFSATAGYKPALVILFTSNPVVISVRMRDSINGNISRCSMPVETYIGFRPNFEAAGSDLSEIGFDGRTGVANQMDQALDVKYTLVLCEDDGLSEG